MQIQGSHPVKEPLFAGVACVGCVLRRSDGRRRQLGQSGHHHTDRLARTRPLYFCTKNLGIISGGSFATGQKAYAAFEMHSVCKCSLGRVQTPNSYTGSVAKDGLIWLRELWYDGVFSWQHPVTCWELVARLKITHHQWQTQVHIANGHYHCRRHMKSLLPELVTQFVSKFECTEVQMH